MRRGLDSFWARGLEIEAPYFLALLGEAHRAAGEKADGLRCVSEGLARAQRTGERWSEAELHRVQADLLIDEDLEGGWRPLPPCHRCRPPTVCKIMGTKGHDEPRPAVDKAR